MLHVITIKLQQEERGVSEERVIKIFAKNFGREPVVTRNEMGEITIYSVLKLSEKQAKAFARSLGRFSDLKGHDGDFSFHLI